MAMCIQVVGWVWRPVLIFIDMRSIYISQTQDNGIILTRLNN